MSESSPWLALLAPLPTADGEWTQETRTDAAFARWTQVRLVLGDAVSTLRVLIAMFDPEGQPGMVSDLVARDGGRYQESAGGRIEPDGRLSCTYWVTRGDQHTPRTLTPEEKEKLRRLALALRQRCT